MHEHEMDGDREIHWLNLHQMSRSIVGGADGTSPSEMRALANVDPIEVARNIAELNPETTLDKH
ncbi:unnamed protein product [Prunus armeniaca]